jgi:hypothetical protein
MSLSKVREPSAYLFVCMSSNRTAAP